MALAQAVDEPAAEWVGIEDTVQVTAPDLTGGVAGSASAAVVKGQNGWQAGLGAAVMDLVAVHWLAGLRMHALLSG